MIDFVSVAKRVGDVDADVIVERRHVPVILHTTLGARNRVLESWLELACVERLVQSKLEGIRRWETVQPAERQELLLLIHGWRRF